MEILQIILCFHLTYLTYQFLFSLYNLPQDSQYTFIFMPLVFMASCISNLSISTFCMSLIILFILKFSIRFFLFKTSFYFSSVSSLLLSKTLASSFITANFAALTFFKFAFSYSVLKIPPLGFFNYILFLIKLLLQHSRLFC